MIGLEQFRENSNLHDICDIYSERWDLCGSKADLFSLACEVQGASYLVKSVSEGWGISPESICESFPDFINGRFVAHVTNSKGRKYDSQMLCMAEGFFDCGTTVCSVIASDVTLRIAPNTISFVFIERRSRVRIICPESSRALVETYSKDIYTDRPENTRIKFLR